MDLLSPWRLVHQVGSAAAACLVVLGVAGCSALPDALNPVEWIGAADSYLTGEEDQTDPELAARAEAENAEPLPGSDEPFPTLGQVPDQAPTVTAYDERQQIAEGLVADRAAARYVDNPAANAFAQEPALPWREPVAPAPVQMAKADPTAPAPETQVTVSEPQVEPVPEPMTAPAAGAVEPAPKPAAKPMPEPEAAAMVEPAPKPKPKPMPAHETAAMEPEPAPEPMTAPAAGAMAPEPMPARSRPAADLPPPAPVATATPRLEATEPARTVAALPSAPAAAAPRAPMPAPRAEAPASSAMPIPIEAAGPGPGSAHAGVIYFAYGSTRVSDADREVLARIAEMQRAQGGTVRIVGHASGRVDGADAVQAKIANFSVAFDRARAVADALTSLGVPQDRVFASSMADEAPAWSESTRLGEAANRRADIYLDY